MSLVIWGADCHSGYLSHTQPSPNLGTGSRIRSVFGVFLGYVDGDLVKRDGLCLGDMYNKHKTAIKFNLD